MEDVLGHPPKACHMHENGLWIITYEILTLILILALTLTLILTLILILALILILTLTTLTLILTSVINK